MFVEQLMHDVRYAVRQLVRAPLFTIVGAISLGMGISIAVAVFAVLNALLFKVPAVGDPARFVHVYASARNSDHRWGGFAYADVRHLQQSGVFTDVTAYTSWRLSVAANDRAPRRLDVQFAAPNYFSALGIRLAAGRAFSADGATSEIVITDQFRRRNFAADEPVLGATIRLNNSLFTVIGVVPDDFRGLEPFSPLAGWVSVDAMAHVLPNTIDWMADGSRFRWSVAGHLQRGITHEAAASRLAGLSRQLASEHPTAWQDQHRRPLQISVLDHRNSVVKPDDTEFLIALATVGTIVGIILLLACTNVAGLLLARAITRRHEIAVRLTLGASRRRLMFQLLTESVLLALLGGIAGIAGSRWVIAFAKQFPSFDTLDMSIDWRVLGAAALLSIGCALVFGTTPIGQALRVDVKAGLAGHGIVAEKAGVRGRLIALQVCLSCLLMLIAVSAGRGIRSKMSTGPAFDLDGILVAELDLTSFRRDTLRRAEYLQYASELLKSLPGVRMVTTVPALPIGNQPRFGRRLELPGTEPVFVAEQEVTPGYFETIGIPVISGRTLIDADVDARDDARAVVNRSFEQAWGSPLTGRRVNLGDRELQVVGVVHDVTHRLTDRDNTPYIYWLPRRNPARSTRVFLLARVQSGAQHDITTALSRRMRERYDDVIPPAVATLRSRVDESTRPQRYVANIALGLGITELVLAALGLYSLLLYSLLARTREVGLRMALGAGPRAASYAVMRAGLVYVAAGMLLGILVCIPAARFAADNFIGVRAGDPFPFVTMLTSVVIAVAAAAWVPARRAARVEPMIALKHE